VLRYDEGIHIGYRAWARAGRTPAYPFGHGLGYTSWEISDLNVRRRPTRPSRAGHPPPWAIPGIEPADRSCRRTCPRRGPPWTARCAGLATFASVHAEPGARHQVQPRRVRSVRMLIRALSGRSSALVPTWNL